MPLIKKVNNLMPSLPLPSSAAALNELKRLHSQAVEWITEQLYQANPQLLKQPGDSGRQYYLEDVDYHLHCLSIALAGESPYLFADHTRWLVSMLKNGSESIDSLRECFHLLEQFISRHLSKEALKPVGQILKEGRRALESNVLAPPAFYRYLPIPNPQTPAFTRAIFEGNRRAAQAIVSAVLSSGATAVDVGVSVIQPALYEVGRLWQMRQISVAREHLATALCQNLLAQSFALAEFAVPRSRKALFACVEGNHHTLGLQITADAFEVEGWQASYLGANVPTVDLLAEIDRWHPDLIGLSLSLPTHVLLAKAVIARCRGEFNGRCPTVIVGGLVLNEAPRLWKHLGADQWCPDARAAQKAAKN
jgi:MerR family transcriptional regulator, light-induced transcriptional regulator